VISRTRVCTHALVTGSGPTVTAITIRTGAKNTRTVLPLTPGHFRRDSLHGPHRRIQTDQALQIGPLVSRVGVRFPRPLVRREPLGERWRCDLITVSGVRIGTYNGDSGVGKTSRRVLHDCRADQADSHDLSVRTGISPCGRHADTIMSLMFRRLTVARLQRPRIDKGVYTLVLAASRVLVFLRWVLGRRRRNLRSGRRYTAQESRGCRHVTSQICANYASTPVGFLPPRLERAGKNSAAAVVAAVFGYFRVEVRPSQRNGSVTKSSPHLAYTNGPIWSHFPTAQLHALPQVGPCGGRCCDLCHKLRSVLRWCSDIVGVRTHIPPRYREWTAAVQVLSDSRLGDGQAVPQPAAQE